MKKNAIIIIAVIAVSIATVKTGYAFYGRQIEDNQTKETQLTNERGNSDQGTAETDFYETENIPEPASKDLSPEETAPLTKADPTPAASGQADDSFTEENCCGSGSVNMIDGNGNLKERETFIKELDEAVKNQDITKEEKEYYLYMYDQCAAAFGAKEGI